MILCQFPDTQGRKFIVTGLPNRYFVCGGGTFTRYDEMGNMDYRPTIAITMGEPAGIGPEVIVKALSDPVLRHKARYIIYG